MYCDLWFWFAVCGLLVSGMFACYVCIGLILLIVLVFIVSFY